MKQLRYVEHLAIQKAYDIKQREFLPPFGAMCGLALSLHVLVLLIWSLMPGAQPFTVPLQALTVRLGGAEDERGSGVVAAAAPLPAKTETEKKPSIPRPAVKEQKPQSTPSPTVKPSAQASVHRALPPPTVSPGTRAVSGLAPAAGEGSRFGNATSGRQVVERYTRQISLQVQAQAKGVRLTEELKQRAHGQRVVVELLLVIGQDGLLQRYNVSRSSGYSELDQAAIGAAYNAAPFPPPPAEYAGYGFKVAVFVE